jgi:exosortase/archaeosortase family protein
MSADRRGSLAPFVLATAAVAAAVVLGPHVPVRAGPYGWLDTGTAEVVSAALRLGGWPVLAAGPVIAHPDGFAMEIYYRCTGLLPAAFLAVAVLAFPVSPRRRWRGLAAGVVLVLAVNLARLVALMVVGVSAPQHFDVAHRVVGEWLVILTVAAYWIAWARGALAADAALEAR